MPEVKITIDDCIRFIDEHIETDTPNNKNHYYGVKKEHSPKWVGWKQIRKVKNGTGDLETLHLMLENYWIIKYLERNLIRKYRTE